MLRKELFKATLKLENSLKISCLLTRSPLEKVKESNQKMNLISLGSFHTCPCLNCQTGPVTKQLSQTTTQLKQMKKVRQLSSKMTANFIYLLVSKTLLVEIFNGWDLTTTWENLHGKERCTKEELRRKKPLPEERLLENDQFWHLDHPQVSTI